MGRMRKTSKELCNTCKYVFKGDNSLICCDYLLITGTRRGCEAGVCDKYEKQVGPRTRGKEIPWSKEISPSTE